jgi:RNA recognition motif-containing protein
MFILLIVDGLPRSYSREQFQALCLELDGVKTARIITDHIGQSLGFGYVEVDKNHADKAIQSLQGRLVGNRPLVVRIANPSPAFPPAS